MDLGTWRITKATKGTKQPDSWTDSHHESRRARDSQLFSCSIRVGRNPKKHTKQKVCVLAGSLIVHVLTCLTDSHPSQHRKKGQIPRAKGLMTDEPQRPLYAPSRPRPPRPHRPLPLSSLRSSASPRRATCQALRPGAPPMASPGAPT